MDTDNERHVPTFKNQLISVSDAATELKMSTRTVHRYIKMGRLKSFVIGSKTRRIRYSALEDFIKGWEAGKSQEPEKRPRQLHLGISYPAGEKEDA